MHPPLAYFRDFAWCTSPQSPEQAVDILSQFHVLGKATSRGPACHDWRGVLIRFSLPQRLDLDAIAQDQLLGVGMQVYLLVHPFGHWVASVVSLSFRAGHKRQNQLALTNRMPLQ
jgi:hypothetical protein